MELHFPLILADIGFIITWGILMLLSTGAALIAARMARPKLDRPKFDDRPTILTERGGWLPRVYGERRVGYVFGWAGQRSIHRDKKRGDTYYEFGVHFLTVGPGFALTEILYGEELIWTTTLARPTFGSGGTVNLPNAQGNFTLCWGENLQPITWPLMLPNVMNIKSSWPFIFWIGWHPKTLGKGGAIWQPMEYTIQVRVENSGLIGSAAWLEESAVGRGDYGVNPAHMLWELLTAPYPHGMAIDPVFVDGGAFEALGMLCETEHLPFNVLIQDGEQLDETISRILLELGMFLDQIGTVLVPIPIRETVGSVPVIGPDLVPDSAPEFEQQHGDYSPDRLRYVFKNKFVNFKEDDVKFDDDGQSRLSNRYKTKPTLLTCVTEPTTAAKIAKRRVLQDTAQAIAFKSIRALRNARYLQPGQAFKLHEDGQQLIVASIQKEWTTREVKIDAAIDQYTLNTGNLLPAIPITEIPSVVPQDPFVLVKEAPAGLSATPAILVERIRAHVGISGAAVYISLSGSSYFVGGSADVPAAGGTLNSPIALDHADDIAEGPTITAYNTDMLDVLDLSSELAVWEAGEQIAVIDDEWFYLQKVEAVSGGWKLMGLKSAQLGSVKAAHEVNAPVVIFNRSNMELIESSIIQSGNTVHVKTQPRQGSLVADITGAEEYIVAMA